MIKPTAGTGAKQPTVAITNDIDEVIEPVMQQAVYCSICGVEYGEDASIHNLYFDSVGDIEICDFGDVVGDLMCGTCMLSEQKKIKKHLKEEVD